jgi:seryl-tRNA synthetase
MKSGVLFKQKCRKNSNAVTKCQKKVGKIKSSGGDASSLIEEVAALKLALTDMEEQDRELANTLDSMLMDYPNILNDDVPDGSDEDENLLIRTHGDANLPDFKHKTMSH